MAPEFFPFIGFGILALVLIGCLAVAAVSLAVTLYLRCMGASRRAARLAAFVCCASLGGFVLVSAALVFLGVNIRQQYFLNEPFVTACGDGDLRRAQQLLSRGASADAYGIDFVDTALIAAASAGHRDVVALLLRSGAHVDLKDIDGKTATDRARENGHLDIVEMLEHAKHDPKRPNQAIQRTAAPYA